PDPAIAVLVKTMTGISAVDPAAYLRQAEELDAKAEKSDGQSHPEVFLRARALDQWWREVEDADDWIEKRLCGPISIESLDLLRQAELSALTRRFFVRFLSDLGVPSDEVATQIRRYFPDVRESDEALDLAAIAYDQIDDATRSYFISLMFD
ncbi:hypothetical protein, partial [Staphylococcus pseudintermedius]|uniref:hypothetical protein n=1 Tax=Staphylococcus pseudintermedius TaxID=283734 RepID=UPI0010DF921A